MKTALHRRWAGIGISIGLCAAPNLDCDSDSEQFWKQRSVGKGSLLRDLKPATCNRIFEAEDSKLELTPLKAFGSLQSQFFGD
jgi:hypothetical protein